MDYPLLKRFQGALLGAISGHDLADRWLKPVSRVSPRKSEDRKWGASIVALTRSLIQNRRFDVVRWHQILQTWAQDNGTSTPPLPGEAAIVALPAILFFHEDPTALRRQLLQLAELWSDADDRAEREAAMLAIGLATADILRSPTDTRAIVPSLLKALSPDTALWQHLEQVQIGLARSANLAEMESRLSPSERAAPAMGLYCFLGTPLDPNLTLRRAVRVNSQPRLTATLSAILSGAHNGFSGIPAAWRSARYGETQIDDMTLLKLAEELLNTWSGIDPATPASDTPLSAPVVTAAPRTFNR